MKKRNGEESNEGELRREYHFDYAKAKPNRFADRLSEEEIVIVLEPDVAAAFPTSEAVNKALRLVMEISSIPASRPE